MKKYDKMVACNRNISTKKIDLARKTILDMVEDGEKVTIPKLIAVTGLSRGFFYKNPTVRKLIDNVMEQQVSMVNPRREILDMVMDNEIEALNEQIKSMMREMEKIKTENEKLKKALEKKNRNILRNL